MSKKNPKKTKGKYLSILGYYANRSSIHEIITKTEHVATLQKLVDTGRRSISNNGYRAHVDMEKNRILVISPNKTVYGFIHFGSTIRPLVVRLISDQDKNPLLEAIYFNKFDKKFSFCRDQHEDMKFLK